MLNMHWVTGVDGEDFEYFDMASWKELVKAGAVSPDDGSGYPAVKTSKKKFLKVIGHTVWPVNEDWDGVVWYNK